MPEQLNVTITIGIDWETGERNDSEKDDHHGFPRAPGSYCEHCTYKNNGHCDITSDVFEQETIDDRIDSSDQLNPGIILTRYFE